MKGSTRTIAAATILAAMLSTLPQPAHAFLPFCGGPWQISGSCQISTTANDVVIFGSGTGGAGPAAVVTVTLSDPNSVVVGSCTDSDPSFASCQTLVTGMTLSGDYTCKVTGGPSGGQGLYGCGEV